MKKCKFADTCRDYDKNSNVCNEGQGKWKSWDQYEKCWTNENAKHRVRAVIYEMLHKAHD